jgi:hypothetical protein
MKLQLERQVLHIFSHSSSAIHQLHDKLSGVKDCTGSHGCDQRVQTTGLPRRLPNGEEDQEEGQEESLQEEARLMLIRIAGDVQSR